MPRQHFKAVLTLFRFGVLVFVLLLADLRPIAKTSNALFGQAQNALGGRVVELQARCSF